MIKQNLHNKKIAIVTGGTSGIGLEIAVELEKQGYFVYRVARHNEYNLANYINCDVSDFESVKQVFESLGKRHGKIDLLINNAGYGLYGAIEFVNLAEAKKLFDVNFFGAIACTQESLKYMERGARIINISSVLAKFPVPYRALYSASKAALSSLSMALNCELKKRGIEVCDVMPSSTKSNFMKNRVRNFETNEHYGDSVKQSAYKIDEGNKTRMSPVVVACAVVKQATAKKMKPAILIGAKYKLFNIVFKFLPVKLYLKIVSKMFS